MELIARIQILDEAVCVSLCADAFEKSMNLICSSPLTPAIGI